MQCRAVPEGWNDYLYHLRGQWQRVLWWSVSMLDEFVVLLQTAFLLALHLPCWCAFQHEQIDAFCCLMVLRA
jgi:hypothetical protein